MDPTMMQVGTVGGAVSVAIMVIGIIYKAVNHKRCRSSCCGKKLEVSLEIDQTRTSRTHVAESPV